MKYQNIHAGLVAVVALACFASSAHAYRDLETGTFLTRDPAGFVDGPNVYTYVRQNPWTLWDPLGLAAPMPPGSRDGMHLTGQDFKMFAQTFGHWIVGMGQDLLEASQYHHPSQGMGGFMNGPPRIEQRQAARNHLEPVHRKLEGVSGLKHSDPAIQTGMLLLDVQATVFGLTSGASVNSLGRSARSLADERTKLVRLTRLRELGLDPARGGQFVPDEAVAALRYEQAVGARLTRSLGVGDFVDDKGRVLDFMGTGMKSDKFNFKNFSKSLIAHGNKQGVDEIVVDMSDLTKKQQKRVTDFVGDNEKLAAKTRFMTNAED